MTSEFDSLLSYDPLLEAEAVTGKSYKEDDGTSALGLFLHMEHSARKRDELMVRQDTYYGIPFTEAVDVALDIGFKPVWTHAGRSHYGNRQKTIMFWHEGILLVMDDYKGALNSANIHFNWRPFSGKSDEFGPIFGLPVSGSMEHRGPGFEDIDGDPWVFVGSIHVVEGLKHRVETLRASGQVLTEWYVTDDLLGVRVGKEVESDFSDRNWHDKVRAKIRERVAEFDEPARSAIQAGMFGKDWE
jgi:hypothetical protein